MSKRLFHIMGRQTRIRNSLSLIRESGLLMSNCLFLIRGSPTQMRNIRGRSLQIRNWLFLIKESETQIRNGPLLFGGGSLQIRNGPFLIRER